jgi:hypothetical protein
MKTPHYHRFSFVNSFDSSSLKLRIELMNRPRTNRWKYFCVVGVFMALLTIHGCEKEGQRISKYVFEKNGKIYWVISPKASNQDLKTIQKNLKDRKIDFRIDVARNNNNEIFYGYVKITDEGALLTSVIKKLLNQNDSKPGKDNPANMDFEIGSGHKTNAIKPFAMSCMPSDGLVGGIEPSSLAPNIREILSTEQPSYIAGNGLNLALWDTVMSIRIRKYSQFSGYKMMKIKTLPLQP